MHFVKNRLSDDLAAGIESRVLQLLRSLSIDESDAMLQVEIPKSPGFVDLNLEVGSLRLPFRIEKVCFEDSIEAQLRGLRPKLMRRIPLCALANAE